MAQRGTIEGDRVRTGLLGGTGESRTEVSKIMSAWAEKELLPSGPTVGLGSLTATAILSVLWFTASPG